LRPWTDAVNDYMAQRTLGDAARETSA